MTQDHDDSNKEILKKVMNEIQKKLPADQAKYLTLFVKQFYGTIGNEDLSERNFIDLYGSILSFWDFMEKRSQGEIKIRVYNPQFEQDGWQSTHTIVEILQADKPFLVDSVTMELQRLGFNIHLIVSLGSLKVRRSDDGTLLEVFPRGTTYPVDVITESAMYLEIDRITDEPILENIRRNLQRVLNDVCVIVSDWKPMLEKVKQAYDELNRFKKFELSEINESKEFLHWLMNDNFTLLGYRDYDLITDKKHKALRAVEDSSLGLFRAEEFARLPKEFNEHSLEYQRLIHTPQILTIAKSDLQSTVHRPAYMDFIGIKRINKKGDLIGERWLFGLFTASAYNTSAQLIPLLGHKIASVIKAAEVTPSSHAGKTLLNILETLPRDDLFQADAAELLRLSMGILQMQERQRIRMFARKSEYTRLVSCLVYIPRERFSTELRQSMQQILEESFHAKEIMFSTRFSDSALARIHFVIRIEPVVNQHFDFDDIERKLIEVGRSWREDLKDYLVEYYGEEKGNALLQRYGNAFPASYREHFSARLAVYDIQHIENVVAGKPLEMNFYKPVDETGGLLRFKVYRLNQSIPLSDVLPILENMGLRVMSEQPHAITFPDGKIAWINDFGMYHTHGIEVDTHTIKEIFQDAFAHIWFGEAENDGFNKLVISVGISWRDVSVFRAYAKYLRQTGFTFSQSYIEHALVNNGGIAARLITLFKLRFDPTLAFKSDAQINQIEEEILSALDAVANLDEDRILRRYLDLMRATLRTNYYQTTDDGQHKSYISFKLNSQIIPDLPLPRPMFEIFVYSPRFEAVHLRGAKVARGGIRWSDRREDFRTEILGLMKAQQVKNAVIVPGGAKGGFFPKMLPHDGDREAIQAEAIACYQNFMRGMLDLTDNLQNGKVVPPKQVVRYDEDDPYLVVAADKGTASFSNIANTISAEYNFWLGDAFASGGSAGYDHKAMGITARGAWESVKRHFRTLNFDMNTTDFTVVGIGDMAGDVFGNGMLLSKHIKLIAAFNHMHIFIDPNPDPDISFQERKRLFELPRSAWSDYTPSLISKGGGVFKRSEKSIKITPEMKEALGITQDSMIPNDLIRAILKAPVDLLWNGGIGTFVKAVNERNVDVGDRTNDAIRINGTELRCKVVGEGGNLGFTQLGRIEYSLNGGLIYTDFIDNSAGVDCSDHEVNIKILLDAVVSNGDMTIKQRNAFLSEMTDEVAALVLKDNYDQTQAISLAAQQAPINIELHTRYIADLERSGKIDRTLESLPDAKVLQERKLVGLGLTRPSLCVLLAYTKMILKAEVLTTNVPEDKSLSYLLEKEFPKPVYERYRKQMEQHSLRREIIATQLVNKMVNEMGFTFVYRLQDETGAPVSAIVRAYIIAREIFQMDDIWNEILRLDDKVPAEVQIQMLLQVTRLIRRSTRWLLRNRRMRLDIHNEIEQFSPGVQLLTKELPNLIIDPELSYYKDIVKNYVANGVSEGLAIKIVSTRGLLSALDIIDAAKHFNFEILDVASMYFAIGHQLELGWLRSQVIERTVESQWELLSREALRDDLDWQQRQLAISILAHEEGGKLKTKEERLKSWLKKYHSLIERWHVMLNELRASPAVSFTMIFVATRELLDLTQTSFQAIDVCSDDHVHNDERKK